MLILCDNTTERVALLGGQLCDNTTEKAALSCNMLWSQRSYEVVMSFTRSKPGPRAVRKIGRNLSGTTHPTLPPIGGRPSYSRPKRDMESEGEWGFLRGSRDGRDRAPQVFNSPLGNSHERERGILNEKSAL